MVQFRRKGAKKQYDCAVATRPEGEPPAATHGLRGAAGATAQLPELVCVVPAEVKLLLQDPGGGKRESMDRGRMVGSAGGVRGLRGFADWSGVASRRRIEPCVRFSRTRLSDIVHRLAYASVGFTVPSRR